MKKFWKIYKISAVIIVSVLIIDLAVVLFFSFYRPTIHKADAIIVLGAAINTPALYNRSLEGLRLYEAGDAKEIILSGGQDYSGAQTEASYMMQTIEASGGSAVPLIIEDKSHSTYDNLKNSKAILGEGKSVIIVSDEYHLARGVLMAWREGFHPVYWSSPKPTYYSKSELAFYYVREMLAMLDYLPKFLFN